MKLIKVLVLLLVAPIVGRAQGHPPVAIDTLVARQLSTYWERQPKDSLACLYGYIDENKVIVVDSAPKLSVTCGNIPPHGVIGMIAFVPAGKYTEEEAIDKLTKVLEFRTDLYIVGMVHGVRPVQYEGKWIKGPEIWGTFRSP